MTTATMVEQFSKASTPTEVILEGIVITFDVAPIVFSLVQPLNISWGKEVTPVPSKYTEVNEVHPSNAEVPIEVTSVGTVIRPDVPPILVSEVQPLHIDAGHDVTPVPLKVIFVKDVHPSKADEPIDVTVEGIVRLVKYVQFLKPFASMAVTL